ncbi:MAG: OmpA family protein [Lysobacteraceae bacterium]
MATTRLPHAIAAGLVAVALVGCTGYIKRDEFDATVAELRATDRDLQRQITGLSEAMERRLADHDARISRMAGRLSVDMTAHFAFDDASIREQDRPVLDEFAAVIREHHPGAVITVEGFTDAAGSAEYNRRLGLRRAEAVRDYLVNQGGLGEASIRAVSYGQDANRQVRPGAWGEDGLANRRVALVVDYVESPRTRS